MIIDLKPKNLKKAAYLNSIILRVLSVIAKAGVAKTVVSRTTSNRIVVILICFFVVDPP